MFYVVSVMMLGYTRTHGLQVYDSSNRSFPEVTPATAKKLIAEGTLKGVTWKNNDDGGLFIPDVEGWNQCEVLVRTGCGKFRPLLVDLPEQNVNSIYTVVRIIDTDYRGRLFEVVSNTCQRIKVTEEILRGLNDITVVAGVRIGDDIEVLDGVEYEDRRESKTEEKTGARKSTTNNTKKKPITVKKSNRDKR